MNTPSSPAHFIRNIIEEDNRTGKWNGRVETRFPPEPNGYLHIGHAKSICLNFGLALEYGGVCHLRFDDTNPEKEAQEYVDAIIESVRWLGFDWKEHLYYASDYFDQLYEFAEYLITQGKAYVDSLSADEIRRLRGTLTEAGTNSPYRDRSAEENLDLFRRMRAGEFPDGVHVLRARIDMASPNINLRDPVIYRIRHIHHQRTGDNGASTRCTITPIAFPMRWNVLPTHSVRWSSKIIDRCTTGYWISWQKKFPAIRSK